MFGKHDSPSKTSGGNLPHRNGGIAYNRPYTRVHDIVNHTALLNNYGSGKNFYPVHVNQSNNESGQNPLASPSPKLVQLNPATL